MTHPTYPLVTDWGLHSYFGSFFGPVADLTTVFGIGLVIAALVALLTSMRRVGEAEFALPTVVAAVGSLLLLVVVILGPLGPS